MYSANSQWKGIERLVHFDEKSEHRTQLAVNASEADRLVRGSLPAGSPRKSVILQTGRLVRMASDFKTDLQTPSLPLDSTLLMAKMSWINRNERKRATVKKYAALRAELKAKKDYAGLAQLPRDASPTRVVNRCEVSGRRRGFIRRFKVSRLTFRELASQGLIPGVTKSSW
jgi:small subunit ribosomal protein S14